MVFLPPSWVPPLPIEPPDSIPIAEFMRNEKYGRRAISQSRNPFTCGLTGRTHSTSELFQRSEFLARALAKRLGWAPNKGTEWDKVLSIFSFNTIDYITVAYGVHRLSGIVTPANAAYSVDELQHQLQSSGAKALVTCTPLLEAALLAAKRAGIPETHVFIIDLPGLESKRDSQFASVEQLIAEGKGLLELEELKWVKGQGARQTAFLCYSSGTSGLPKAVMISHRNIIANVLQHSAYEAVGRKKKGMDMLNVAGILPFSHIFALVMIAHSQTFRGDGVIVLPKFDFAAFLNSIQKYKINELVVVPPIIIGMLRNKEVCRKYDLSSVHTVFSGAAPLGDETIRELKEAYPQWTVGQGYGMTETAVVVSCPNILEDYPRGSGSLMSGIKVKLLDASGNEVTEHETRGELYIQGPMITLGYLNNAAATAETFVHHADGRWIRTGDEALVGVTKNGNENIVIVDRIKELIKVKGHQVAPAELEAHILSHSHVADCAVIQVPDERAGEVPKAFVVKAADTAGISDDAVREAVLRHVADHKAPYKRITGGVEFVPEIPKSPSGKILRRVLRDREAVVRANRRAKL